MDLNREEGVEEEEEESPMVERARERIKRDATCRGTERLEKMGKAGEVNVFS